MITVGTTVVSGSPINGGGGGAGLPVATGAGEVPLSTGAGTTYAATPIDEVVIDGLKLALTGEPAGAAIISDGAGDVIPTSADVSAVLAAADAAAARAALGVQDGPRFVSVCAFGSAGIVLDEIGGAQVDPADYAVAGRTLSLSLRLYGDVPSGTTATVRLWRLPREAWLVGTAYIEGEVVVSGGSQWRALVNVTGGSAPSEGATWTANTALASVAITAAYPTLAAESVTVPLSAAVYALDAQAVGAGLVTVRGASLRLTWS